MNKIKKILELIEKNGYYPDLKIIDGAATPEVMVDGKKVLILLQNSLGVSPGRFINFMTGIYPDHF